MRIAPRFTPPDFAPDGALAAASEQEGDLPSWDLSDLYPGPQSPEIAADFAEAERAAGAFEAGAEPGG